MQHAAKVSTVTADATPALGRTRSTRGIRPCVLTPTSSMGSLVLYRMLTACSMLLMKD